MEGTNNESGKAGVSMDVVVSAGGKPVHRVDWITPEEPLQLVLEQGGKRMDLAVIMRTPLMDTELAAGFLFTEGLIASRDEIQSIELEGSGEGKEGNVIRVKLSGDVRKDVEERRFSVSSSCGICGKSSINELYVRGYPIVRSTGKVDRSVIISLPDRMRSGQKVFLSTGGIHAAGLFRYDGSMVAVCEDIGRHNAVDKIAGFMLLSGHMKREDYVLQVSGRAGFEIVQKAVAMGIPVVSSISAPSSLAIETADAFGITLACFVRDGKFNVYSHAERLNWD